MPYLVSRYDTEHDNCNIHPTTCDEKELSQLSHASGMQAINLQEYEHECAVVIYSECLVPPLSEQGGLPSEGTELRNRSKIQRIQKKVLRITKSSDLNYEESETSSPAQTINSENSPRTLKQNKASSQFEGEIPWRMLFDPEYKTGVWVENFPQNGETYSQPK